MNERKTEQLVRKKLKQLGYYEDEDIIVEEQQSSNIIIKKHLSTASKRGNGQGYPEFIITKKDSELLIVIECKASVSKHESKNLDIFSEYAVDGAILYGAYLSKGYHVVCIGISGEDEQNMRFSAYYYLKQSNSPEKMKINEFLSFKSFERACRHTGMRKDFDFKQIKKNTKEIHKILREKIKLSDEQKPVIISGILLALSEPSFEGYKKTKNPNQLLKLMITSIENKLDELSGLPKEKIDVMLKKFNELSSNNKLSSTSTDDSFKSVITKVQNEIMPYMNLEDSFDYIGEFYKEFLKYTDGNRKGLGIVLTPAHITDLFAEIADLTVDDVVIDPCCGTGGFLISAMNYMISKTDDVDKIMSIKKNQLIGVEDEAKMFTLAASNMILRGDGKANLYNEDCFNQKLHIKIKKNYKPTVGMINPPYSQTEEGLKELDFIYNMLEMLEVGGIGIGIVPINCAISSQEQRLREKILEKHTLIATMSMPTTLFYPVGTITCIMVFKAHRPHNSKVESWFGYWRDDGFVNSRNAGRIDKFEKWKTIKEDWINSFRNREANNLSVKKAVDASMEWCAEAYMETDYSLSEEEFISALREFYIYESMYSQEDL